MSGTPPVSVARAYNLGLKVVPNFVRMEVEVIEYYENHLDEIPAALTRGFTIPQKKFELFLHEKQKSGGWIEGFELETHLKKSGLIDRTLSLEDEPVKGWLDNPSTYPGEFKGKAVFLWKSQQGAGRFRLVAYLIWSGGRVVVDWGWLGSRWHGFSPALLG